MVYILHYHVRHHLYRDALVKKGVIMTIIANTLTCTERGAHILHLFDSLPESTRILIIAVLFFVIGVLTPIILRKSKENTEKQRKEELDEEIDEQLREIELITKGSHKNDAYEELLSKLDELKFNF